MLVDRGGLWFRVLVARDGMEQGRLREGGRMGSAWWREIVRIRDGVGGIRDAWFRECVSRKVAVPDRWQWRLDPVLGYSVRGAYQLLTSQDSVTLGEAEDLIWHRQVPSKVSIFAWRLLRDRLPTKTNLVSRGILPPDLHFCASGCGDIETAQHLFLSCGTF
ncbi:hypothetical protein QL285_029238 [Trifolium repens]|nr:hypothetical protein QL285_029238 [Trifolium repens]